MIDAILAILAGIGLGIVTGLLPGIHINLVMTVLVPLVITRTATTPFSIALGIVALTATHTILDFIPSIYLGAPEEETALSILPAHQLLHKGRGHEAALLVVAGAMVGLVALLGTAPGMILLMPLLESRIERAIPFVLLGVVVFMIAREERPLPALVCFTSAGFLGYAALNLPVNQPLFPLLGGLFGMSGLVLALKQKTALPPQEKVAWKQLGFTKKDALKTLRDVVIAGIPCSILPALGSGYASLIASEASRPTNRRFLAITSAMNTYIAGVSFILVVSIGKARTGAAAVVEELLEKITYLQIGALITVFILITLGATCLATILSRKFATYIDKIAYNKVSLVALAFIVVCVGAISHVTGLLILATGTALGIYAINSNIKRMHLMGCLLVPTLLAYLL